ncbi:hypothetical protein [Phyllobacterium zundukense]|jgi:hypothetical protein|uniref:Uncharacterized protein n=1 Tax=Phyllobacterium zundukense TaxID=1867719 RepID=A0ACD4D081_9HYPH|nr:hypothetical protein [Phyllobacterium zundukense]UXN59255.1 hypothetical protein N8E88_21945 [Phyllobacterium zundukense]
MSIAKRDVDIVLRPVEAVPENLVVRRLATVATVPYTAPACLDRIIALQPCAEAK